MLIRPAPRRGLFFPPGATPRINEAHPAAGLLQAAYLFGPQPLAVLPGFGGLSVKTGTPVPAIGRTGVYTAYTATSGHVAASSPTGDISIVAVAMRSITPGSAGFVSNVQVAASSISVFATRNGIEFDIGNSYVANPLRMSAYHYDAGGSQIAADGMWVNGGKETISGGVGSTDLANGVWYGVGATMSGVIAGNGALTIGDFVDNTFALTGGVQFLVLFRGILPDGLMSELTDNPAGLLLWPEDEAPTLATPLGTQYSLTTDPLSYEYTVGDAGLGWGRTLDTGPLSHEHALGDVDFIVRRTLDAEAVAYEYSVPSVALDYTPAQTGDTHDGFVRRSRRERALAAAERRRRDDLAQEAVALRLSLEAAMGMAAEVAEDATAEAAEAVQAATKRAARLVPTLADARADEALLASAREAVAALRAAVEEAERARALAEDDEEVLMLLRAL